MFMIVEPKKCPSCTTSGKIWKKNPEIFVCPNCSTVFNEFGILIVNEEEKEMQVS